MDKNVSFSAMIEKHIPYSSLDATYISYNIRHMRFGRPSVDNFTDLKTANILRLMVTGDRALALIRSTLHCTISGNHKIHE